MSGRRRKDSQSEKAEKLVEKLEAGDKAEFIIFNNCVWCASACEGIILHRNTQSDNSIGIPVKSH